MSPIEFTLVAMVGVWTVVSIALGVLVFFMFRELQKALEKINQVLASTRSVAQDIQWPVHTLVTGLQELLAVLTAPKEKEVPPLPADEKIEVPPGTEFQPH
jgi:hypothetical protein